MIADIKNKNLLMSRCKVYKNSSHAHLLRECSSEQRRALSALREHAERYPRGALQEMRKVTRIMAPCALGQVDTARHEAEAFLSEFKRSSYAARVRQLCDAPAPASQLP